MKQYYKNIYTNTKESYYDYLEKSLKEENKLMIVTANPETLTYAEKDKEIAKMLLDKNNSVVPDGIAIVKTARMLGIDVKERITGVDIAEQLLIKGSKQKKKIFIFGSKQEVLDNMDKVLKEKYSGLKVVGLVNGYVDDRDKVFEDIKKAKPDIVLVALGIPYQEKLIYKHLKDFNKGIFVGVGGSIDVLSGSKKRAPKFFIKTNTEWLYRIICEPKRIKRFWNNNVKFMFKIKKEK